MCGGKSALIGCDTYTTLLNVRSVVAVLKEFYCLNDIPGKKPPPSVSPELFTGLYFILDNIDEALAYEMGRISGDGGEVIPPLISD